MEARKTALYTQKDIARDLNLSVSTVTQCLKDDPHYRAATIARVKAYAAQVGYNKEANIQNRLARASQAKADYLESGDKPMTAYRKKVAVEAARMLNMRKAGFTNMAIAKKSGYDVTTVVNRIGTQPHCMTAASRKLAGEYKKKKNALRMALAQQIALEEYNRMAEEAQGHIRALNELKANMEAYKDSKPELKLLK